MSVIDVWQAASIIRGIGGYLPERILTNHYLADSLDTNDEWIKKRTGIVQRHIAASSEDTVNLGYHALKAALYNAKFDESELGALIVATSTPSISMPSTAALLHGFFKLDHCCLAFDISAACSGFVYAILIAQGLGMSGIKKPIAIVGVDIMSRILDWTDRKTCVLFGDGAGAIIIDPQQLKDIMAIKVYADGELSDILRTHKSDQSIEYLYMKGPEVFKAAVERMSAALEAAVKEAGIMPSEIDLIIPHQANARIIQAVIDKFAIPQERVFITIDHHANTAAASIPLAMWDAMRSGVLNPGTGQIIAMLCAGAGFTWGCAIMRV